jgi:hypothetical protein
VIGPAESAARDENWSRVWEVDQQKLLLGLPFVLHLRLGQNTEFVVPFRF